MDDLISRAAAIEHMKSMAGCATCNNYNGVRCRACIWDDAMNIVDEAPAVYAVPVVQQWINIKDRLPADRGHYLVMLKTDGKIGFEVHTHLIRILYFGSEGWRLPRHFPEWIHEALKQEVTHWMPLPEPPKMDGEPE